MDREKITLTGSPETMLATLYARAVDSRAKRPILNDQEAARAVERIEYDFRRTGINAMTAAGVALRARQLDGWTKEFLAAHPEATVLHLACGLDTRVQRLDRSSATRWIDVDYPEVLDLRDRLLLRPSGDYRMIATSVTDDEWLTEVPADRPTAVVFEGLSMYLRKDQGKSLIQRLTARFPSGELLFDSYGSMGIRLQRWIPAIRNAGARLYWAIDDPYELEAWHPGLTCVTALSSTELTELAEFPPAARVGMWVMARIPGLRDAGRLLRYTF
ncbi:class I SAM-dependent methyltransferase [Acrocarpospora macrocephala]|uniref:Putative polyketide synthase protein n=1 Tax=Acrocarpospora macrocephala TaxID=150177 RepID=A0A5M3WIT7_9ACTN|nr:class I SAM-dependent methyltransferase [Acrocarpospora macrocephala]GES08884.1 putative polyketide synthase protein [Acrocarpospora macrocephala]